MYTTEATRLLKLQPKYLSDDGSFRNPETGQEMKHTDFMSIAASQWNNLTDKEKAPYEKLAETDKARYDKQM